MPFPCFFWTLTTTSLRFVNQADLLSIFSFQENIFVTCLLLLAFIRMDRVESS
jgi:hypothetical protein